LFRRSSILSGDIVQSADGTKLYFPNYFLGLEVIDISNFLTPMIIDIRPLIRGDVI
jgi:hypothetical protein